MLLIAEAGVVYNTIQNNQIKNNQIKNNQIQNNILQNSILFISPEKCNKYINKGKLKHLFLYKKEENLKKLKEENIKNISFKDFKKIN